MANVKITALTSLTANETASADVLPVVDVSADATKKLAISDLHRSVPDGTLSAPGIAFQSDLNSGLYRSGTDAIALVTNGAARILIDATGNVTIPNDLTVQGATTFITGQTVLIEDKNIELGVVSTPTDVTADGGGITLKGATDKTIQWINSTGAWTFNQPVDISGDVQAGSGAADARITIGSHGTAGTNDSVHVRADGANLLFMSGSGGLTRFEQNGSTRFTITSTGNAEFNGNVGVNTSSFPANGKNLKISDGTISRLVLEKTGTGARVFEVGAGNSFLNVYDATADEERVRIDSNGNVGLGTASPNNYNNYTTLTLNDTTGGEIDFESNGTLVSEIYSSASNGLNINTRTAVPIRFGTNASGNRLVITSTGNAEFSGQVKADSTSGAFQASRSDGAANHVFRGGTSTSNYTSVITANGQLTLSGTSGALQATRSDGSANHVFRAGTSTSNYTTVITAGGSATFAGPLLVNTSTARTNYFNTAAYGSLVNFEGTGNSNRIVSFVHNDSSGGPMLVLGATGGSAAGSNTLVSSSVTYGIFSFQGSDGTELVEAARIAAESGGHTPAANDMPGSLVFSTTSDGGSGVTRRMVLNENGNLSVGVIDNVSSFKRGRLTVKTADSDITRGEAAIYIEEKTGGEGFYIGVNSDGGLFFDNSGTTTPFFIGDNDNVGIGTSSPGHVLTVRVGTANQAIANFTGGTVGRGLVIETDNDGGVGDDTVIYNATQSTGSHVFKVNSTERLRIDSSGRLLKSGEASLTSTSLSHPVQIAADGSAQNIVCFGRASDDISAIDFYEADKSTNLGEIQYRPDHANFRHRVGDIRFATGGTTEKMRIDSSGNVGIGTTNVQKRLHVRKDGDSYPMLVQNRTNASSTCGIALIATGSDFADGQYASVEAISGGVGSTAHGLGFRTCASGGTPSTAMRITSSGNVGIGTTSPDATLQLVPSAVDTNIFSIRRQDHASVNLFRFFQDSNVAQGTGAAHLNTENRDLIITASTAANITDGIYLETNGNVGIGTVSPNRNLSVFDSSNAGIEIQTGTSGQSSIFFTDTADTNIGMIGYYHNDDAMFFRVNDDERMRIDSSGNVGIGKSSSLGAKLHIQDDSATETTQIKLRNYTSGVNTKAGLMFECSTSGGQGGNSVIRGVCGADAGGSNSQNDGGLEFLTSSGGSGTLATVMHISSSERVGINTSNPSRALTIAGSMNLSSGQRIESESSAGNLYIQGGSTYPGGHIKLFGGQGGDKIEFRTTGVSTTETVRMVMDDSHFVIGGETTSEDDQANFDMNGMLTVRRASATDDAIIVREGSTLSWLVDADGRCQSFNVGSLAFLAYDTESTGANNSAYAAMGSINGEARITGGHSDAGDTPLVFRTASSGTETEEMRLLPGGGLTFNGDTAQANALDDYEEGTWTPFWGSTTGSFGSITYTVQSGRYTKIGDRVHVDCRLRSSALAYGTAGGSLLVGGLPFTNNSSQLTGGSPSLYNIDVATGTVNIATEGRENATSFYAGLCTRDNNSFLNVVATGVGTGLAIIRVSFCYRTNS